MATLTTTPGVRAEFWPAADNDIGMAEHGRAAELEAVRDEDGAFRVALHTMVDGRGSVTSYYLDREAAIGLARDILAAVDLRDQA